MATRDLTAEPLPAEVAPEPPPRGPWVWIKENLLSTKLNVALTLISMATVFFFVRGLLAFTVSPERRWEAVATNMRLYMTQAYPENQYLRVWVSLGIIMVLTGLSLAIWRTGGATPVRKITRGLMGVAAAIGFVSLLLFTIPEGIATVTKVWFLLAAAVVGVVAYAVDRSLGDRAKQITVPSLAVVAGATLVGLIALWTLPIGHYAFTAGEAQPPEPGTIALSTKLPLTVMALVLVGAYFVGMGLRNRVAEGVGRTTLVLLWVASMPVLVLVVLRDPQWDFGRLFGIDLALLAGFALVGGGLIAFLSNPELHERGRLVSGLLLIVALGAWAFPMLIRIRILLLLLAVFAIAAPTFAGDSRARRRYLAIWGATLITVILLLAVADTPSTLVIQASNFLGGLSLTFLLALSGILISFPIGVLMALGRTSTMPIFRVLSTIYIEVVRGIPFITVLIFADIILELFLPEGLELDDVVQAIAATALFSGAYLAENVRGGLQSIRKGQYEASRALGMSTLQLTTFIVLPQALRAVIPALVGQTIAIFKDTSLVAIIGLFDFLFVASKVVPTQLEFLGARRESLLFVALGYWLFTFSFSRASIRLEKKVGLGER